MVLRSICKPRYELVKAALSTAPPKPISEEALFTAPPGLVSEEGMNPFCIHTARAMGLSTGILGEVAELPPGSWMITDMWKTRESLTWRHCCTQLTMLQGLSWALGAGRDYGGL